MSMMFAALVSFLSIALLLTHLSPHAMRRIAGYAMWVDICLHATILYMFIGTSTLGLLQAEASGILFSLGLRGYRWLFGYEKLVSFKWTSFPGALARLSAR